MPEAGEPALVACASEQVGRPRVDAHDVLEPEDQHPTSGRGDVQPGPVPDGAARVRTDRAKVDATRVVENRADQQDVPVGHPPGVAQVGHRDAAALVEPTDLLGVGGGEQDRRTDPRTTTGQSRLGGRGDALGPPAPAPLVGVIPREGVHDRRPGRPGRLRDPVQVLQHSGEANPSTAGRDEPVDGRVAAGSGDQRRRLAGHRRRSGGAARRRGHRRSPQVVGRARDGAAGLLLQ